MHVRSLLFAAVLVLITPAESADSPKAGKGADVPSDPRRLSLQRIFSSPDFNTDPVPFTQWRGDGAGYYHLEPWGTETNLPSLVFIDAASGARECMVEARQLIPRGDTRPLPIQDLQFSADGRKLLIFTHSQRVWRQNTRGDYWVMDLECKHLERLGGGRAPGSLMFAKFSPDSQSVAFVHDNNIHLQHLSDLRVVPLTRDGSPSLINGTADWVYEEELEVRDAFRWSPDGRFIAFWQTDTTGVREFTMIRNTDELYPTVTRWPYPKAGERNSSVRVGVVDAGGTGVRWMELPGDPREHYVARVHWVTNSTELLIQQMNRLQNTNTVFRADVRSGASHVVMVERDDAWIENENDIRWVNRGDEFLWLSDRSGWQHIHRVHRVTGEIRPVTSGAFDVTEILAVDEERGWIYHVASPDNPTQRYLHRVPVAGGVSERVSGLPGTHRYRISPNGEWAVHTHSAFLNPPVTDLIHLPGNRPVRVLSDNQRLRKSWVALERPQGELLRVPLDSGHVLDAWCLRPPGFRRSRTYPVLFHVYGEPHGQVVTDAWQGRGGLWHSFLAQQGYVIIAIDNRGTYGPRGREWRKAAHKQVGILTVADQAAAVRSLLRTHRYLDGKRVGIWGWSGGGSMSLNAIFQHPDVYQAAIAVAAVPNQRYYDTIYQERYMGLPRDNPEGYRLGSPITHAHRLKGRLLLIHGTGDDNVHYQGMEALVNELVAHQKPFTMMSYPDRSHSISEGRGTTLHLYELMSRFLRDNLPPAARRTLPNGR